MMNKGFTLIEIMIVVAIAMVLTTVGVMAVGKRMENNAITRVRTELPTYLRGIIDRSFSEGRRYGVAITADGRLTLSNMDANNNITTNIETVEFPDNLVYTVTPNSTIMIGERGEFLFGTETQVVIEVRKSDGTRIMTITGSNIAGVNLGRIVEVNN